MRQRRENLDRVFLGLIGALLLTGLVALYSASQPEEPVRQSALEDTGAAPVGWWRPTRIWWKQVLFAVLGILGFAMCASIPHPMWRRLSRFVYPLTLLALIAVLVAGSAAGGATRWLAVGPLRFQPSEMAKLATVLFMARVLAARRRSSERLFDLVVPVTIALVPAALILMQPDLGTAFVFFVLLPPMLFWSGVSTSYLLLVASPALSVLCSASLASWILFTIFLLVLAYHARALLAEKILFVSLSVGAGIVAPMLWDRLKPYQQQRLTAFLNPESYSSGAGYQIIQSKVAVGSGGLAGVGFLDGTQKNLEFLPARHTDFIFSVVGEEFGFLGSMTVLVLFILLVARGLRIAAAARDPFAGLTVVGILSMLAFQVLVNIGVSLGLVPVTGLPLPIYSYGGTSLVATLAGLGIVLGVGLRRRI